MSARSRCALICTILANGSAAHGGVQYSSTVSTPGPQRGAPLYGLGNEFIFQSVADSELDALLVAASSAVSRYPGGTPSDYFDWASGWMDLPTGAGCGGCDEVPWRPTRLDALSRYLGTTHQSLVYVLNQLNSSLEHELDGLRALVAALPAGTPLRIEMGNEMYDASRADVVAAYPAPADYARKMGLWSAAIKAALPNATIGWVGLANDWDARTRAWNAAVFSVDGADAATIHLYPGLPSTNVSSGGPPTYPALLATLAPLLDGYASYTAASIPPRLRLWVTEAGTWGNPSLIGTWLQGLWHAAFALLVPLSLGRVDVMLPYCAVCGDENMPSFTTDAWGAVVPPNTTVPPGAWRRTASGHGYALVYAAVRGAATIEPLAFAPNAVVDPAVPSSRALVGMRAVAGGNGGAALVLANLGAASAELDVSGVAFGACDAASACASVYAPRNATDAARQGLRVEELAHTVGPVGAALHLELPAYAVAVVACACREAAAAGAGHEA